MPTRGGKWTILAVLSLVVVVASLDNTVLNVALPVLARDLAASNSQLQCGPRSGQYGAGY